MTTLEKRFDTAPNFDASIAYENIRGLAEQNRGYLRGQLDDQCLKTVELSRFAVEMLKDNVPGVLGGMCVGFPFHSQNASGEIVPNPEFDRYSGDLIRTINLSEAMSARAIWACGSCQMRDEFSPQQCAPCSEPLKPRTIMKAMPDVDMFLMVEDVSPDILTQIERVARTYGFAQSDHSAAETLSRIQRSFDQSGEFRLPFDLHVIDKGSYMNSMELISRGSTFLNPQIVSMYYTWKENKDIDFWFDFVFSGQTISNDLPDDMADATIRARAALVNRYANEYIINIICSKSSRAKKLLEHSPTRQLLIEKLDRWRLG